MADFSEKVRLWKIYCVVQKSIADAMGRTKNIVGEFAEQLVFMHYGGKLSKASTKGYDLLLDDGKKVQVKARMSENERVQLSDFRSDNYDFLVVVVFSSRSGLVLRAAMFKKDDVEIFKKKREAQNRFTVITSDEFWEKKTEDITDSLNALLKSS